jgi:hypothetical protein
MPKSGEDPATNQEVEVPDVPDFADAGQGEGKPPERCGRQNCRRNEYCSCRP